MYNRYNEGYIEIIAGCMFAGKTEELIRRVNVLSYANKKIEVFKPKVDNRYSDDHIVSHSGTKIKCTTIEEAKDIFSHLDHDTEVVAIDEVQFFDPYIVDVCNELAEKGIRVMAAGLDMDFRGVPFGPMAMLITTAEFVTKLTAVCTECGSPATRSQRLVSGESASKNDEIVSIGAQESYEARCRHHHFVEV